MAISPNICDRVQPEIFPTNQAGGFLSSHEAYIVMFQRMHKASEDVRNHKLVDVVFVGFAANIQKTILFAKKEELFFGRLAAKYGGSIWEWLVTTLQGINENPQYGV